MLRFVGLPKPLVIDRVTVEPAEILAAARPVEITCFNDRLSTVLCSASIWSLRAGVTVDVNAIDNGEHGSGTLHGDSKALDLDTEGDRRGDLAALHRWLSRDLPPGYDVVLEDTHVHIEWDTKRR